MPNTLTAITALVTHHNTILKHGNKSGNRIQHVGAALETYVKDLYADSFLLNKTQKLKRYNQVFSHTGSNNKPPDSMLKGGDAIEIKKLDSLNGEIQLNSSYPKHKLKSDNPYISKKCRDCEVWSEKDIIYAIGSTQDEQLRLLWLVYGDCYAADIKIYTDLKQTISDGINKIPNVVFNETNELGRVNLVDPLKIASLRVRGMWIMQHPNVVFSSLNAFDPQTKFQLICLFRNTKYLSFAKADRLIFEGINNPNLEIKKVSVRDPNNPQVNIDCKLITYKIY